MKTGILTVLYFLTGVTFIMLEFKSGFLPEVAVKALIIPVLIIIFKVNFRLEKAREHGFMFFALLFSWAGDVALAFSQQNEIWFMIGLVCFMLTQLLYLTIFSLTPGKNYALKKFFYFILPVYIYGAGLLYYLYDDLGELKIPVIAYTVVLLTMLAAAVSRIKKVSRISFYLVLIGAVLFVISDSLIAINKFSYPFAGSSICIMSTYITGQYLIVMGYIKQYRLSYA